MKIILVPSFLLIMYYQADNMYHSVDQYASSSLKSIELAIIRKVASFPFLYFSCTYIAGNFHCNPYSEKGKLNIVDAIILGPVIEEVLERGCILSFLDQFEKRFLFYKFHNKFAITLSSLSFGVMHFLNPNPSYTQVINSTVGGFLYAYLYSKDGIHASIICHMTNNALSLFLESYFLGWW